MKTAYTEILFLVSYGIFQICLGRNIPKISKVSQENEIIPTVPLVVLEVQNPLANQGHIQNGLPEEDSSSESSEVIAMGPEDHLVKEDLQGIETCSSPSVEFEIIEEDLVVIYILPIDGSDQEPQDPYHPHPVNAGGFSSFGMDNGLSDASKEMEVLLNDIMNLFAKLHEKNFIDEKNYYEN